jgi:hypothetical protein
LLLKKGSHVSSEGSLASVFVHCMYVVDPLSRTMLVGDD